MSLNQAGQLVSQFSRNKQTLVTLKKVMLVLLKSEVNKWDAWVVEGLMKLINSKIEQIKVSIKLNIKSNDSFAFRKPLHLHTQLEDCGKTLELLGGKADWKSRVVCRDGVWVEWGRGKLNLQLVYDHSEGKGLQRRGKVEDKRLLEHYRRGGGDRGWYLSVSGEGTWLSGVRQLVLALLTLSREGCRSLEAPQHNMPSNGGGDRRRGQKQTQREKHWTNRKNVLKESPVRFPKSKCQSEN